MQFTPLRFDGTEAGQVMLVSAIEGMAGIGKTQLALHVSHRLVRAGRYGDLQLHVNLRGFDVAGRPPADPYQVLEQFLRELDWQGRVPLRLQDRIRAYRSRIAGRNALVLLDNAATAEQVRPLLPESSTVLTIVTSAVTTNDHRVGDTPGGVRDLGGGSAEG